MVVGGGFFMSFPEPPPATGTGSHPSRSGPFSLCGRARAAVGTKHRRQGLEFARPDSNAGSGYRWLVGNLELYAESWRLRRHEDCGADWKLGRLGQSITARSRIELDDGNSLRRPSPGQLRSPRQKHRPPTPEEVSAFSLRLASSIWTLSDPVLLSTDGRTSPAYAIRPCLQHA